MMSFAVYIRVSSFAVYYPDISGSFFFVFCIGPSQHNRGTEHNYPSYVTGHVQVDTRPDNIVDNAAD